MRLISDASAEPGELPATKENIESVLRRLQPQKAKADLIHGLPQPTPDDLVLIFFSSHGYTDPANGSYYFFPHDVGDDFALQKDADGDSSVPVDLLSRLISSEEISHWLRPIDAGEMVLIVDTCHSAATVDQPGFKPGPMGSRGLGQLAYDKGMRILAASQADDVAIESEQIEQGLLTYALVRDGLEQRLAADNDGRITIAGWLSYAEQRVPTLYEEVLNGEVKTIIPRQVLPIAPDQPHERTVQRPTLFDYSRSQFEVTLDEK